MLDTPVWIILTIVLLVCIVRLRARLAETKRVLEGINNPVTFLPEKEQAEWARKVLADEAFERDVNAVNNFNYNRER